MAANRVSDLTLVDTLHAAAVEPARWPDALDLIRRACDADSAALTVQDVSSGTGTRIDVGYEVDSRQRYFDGFSSINPLFQRLLRRPFGVPHPDQALVDSVEFRKGHYFNEWCRPHGIHFLVGWIVNCTRGDAEWITLNRDRGRGPYQPEQLRRLARLAPHLRRAVETRRLLGEAHAARAAWEMTLDTLRHGVVLLDQRGGVVFANRSVRDLARARDGVELRGDGFSAVAQPGALARLVAIAATGDDDGVRCGGQVSIKRRSPRRPLLVEVAPLPRDWAGQPQGEPAVLVLLTDPEEVGSPEASRLMALFELTSRESELAVALSLGDSLSSAAGRLGIGRETARTHLAHALAKTGSGRQVDLVRLALSLTPPFRANPG